MNKFLEWEKEKNCLYDEAFIDSFKKNFNTSYQNHKNNIQNKYQKTAIDAISKVKLQAETFSKKLGLPLPLTLAVLASLSTGGVSAIPFSIILYYSKEALMTAGSKTFDTAWDAGNKAIKNFKTKIQPENTQYISFSQFIEDKTWGDWAGRNLGTFSGSAAGKITGNTKQIYDSITNRLKEIHNYIKNNPKDFSKIIFLLGLGVAMGYGTGKISNEIKDVIIKKMTEYNIPQNEMNSLLSNVGLSANTNNNNNTTNTGNVAYQVVDYGADATKHSAQYGKNKNIQKYSNKSNKTSP